MELRAKTISEIRNTLDESYFTAESFRVENRPHGTPFLMIKFMPSPKYVYALFEDVDGQIRSEESPGELVAASEEHYYKNLQNALSAIRIWIRRIREEYQHAAHIRDEIDDFLNQLRQQTFENIEGEDPSITFTDDEIQDLRSRLDQLKEIVTTQAGQLEANAHQISHFEKEIESIKQDLNGMPKSVWRKVASNKILKSVKIFLATPEGRALVADGLKKLIGMD